MLREALFAQNRIFAKIHTFPAQSDFYHEITHLRSKMHFWLKNAILRILDQKASIWHLFLHGLAQNAKTCDFVKNLRAQEKSQKCFLPKRIFANHFSNLRKKCISDVSRFTTQLQRSR